MLIQITAKHFTAGAVLDNKKVIEAAPIIRYMIGWGQEQVQRYCSKKNWEVIIIN